jgi:hypothetical protein
MKIPTVFYFFKNRLGTNVDSIEAFAEVKRCRSVEQTSLSASPIPSPITTESGSEYFRLRNQYS